MNPDASHLIQVFLRKGLLPLIWLSLIALQAAIVLWAFSGRSVGWGLRRLLAGGLALGLLILYWYGAEGQLLFYNVDMGRTDQSAYMDYARQLKVSGYAYPGDFNRMPVYPFLLSLVLRPGMTDPQFFMAAKYLNIFLSIVLLALLAVIFFRRYSPLHALNLVLIVAFTVYVYKAAWVQAEVLFYFLNTCLFLLLWTLLRRPEILTAIGAGVIAGIAHLTKASLWPGLLVFGLTALLQGTAGLVRNVRSKEPQFSKEGSPGRVLLIPLAGIVFLAVIAPYLRMSQRLTGHTFYNVNSTFYVWYDSWQEAEAGTKAHGDRTGWPDMPSSEIPSLAKYLREHTARQMVQRVVDGGQEVMDHVLSSYGYFDYLLVYGGLLILASVARWRKTRRLIAENSFFLFFVLSYFAIYVLLYFWYAPITAGDRLILALFIPLLLVLSSGLRSSVGASPFEANDRMVDGGESACLVYGGGRYRAGA
jgi:hypothetical protein